MAGALERGGCQRGRLGMKLGGTLVLWLVVICVQFVCTSSSQHVIGILTDVTTGSPSQDIVTAAGVMKGVGPARDTRFRVMAFPSIPPPRQSADLTPRGRHVSI
eukprot:2240525-Rhodomonas_salina.2